jgi:hypothetical protein
MIATNPTTIGNYPRLKSGVTYGARGDEIYVGLPTFGVMIAKDPHLQTLRYFDGHNHIKDIANGLGVDLAQIQQLQRVLIEYGLLETLSTPELVGRNESHLLIRARLQAELDLITHRTGSSDGGSHELHEREAFTILISGENRLARNLLAALQGIGFANTRIIKRAFLSTRIEADDVCGFTTRTTDIGKSRIDFSREIIRNSQILKSELLAKANPDLIISTIPLEWDYVQRWMSEGSKHLHINSIIGNHVEIGPLVIPGITPCLRCVTLTKRDLEINSAAEKLRTELPTAASAYIAGLIAMCVSEYVATNESSLMASSYWLDLLAPLSIPEHRYWGFHGSCGCQ